VFDLILAAATAVAAGTPAPLGAAAPAAPAATAGAASAGAVPATNATLSPQLLQQLGITHKSPLAAHAPWLAHGIAGIFLIFGIALIALLAMQTTKQDGLSGTLGGRVEAGYKPRLGMDQQIARLTTFVAIGFVFFGVCTSLTGF